MLPRVSVVICTDDRKGSLADVLMGLRQLRYPAFEVCFVCGPTDDGSWELLQEYGHNLKLVRCAERNISKSRNIGIAASRGDIVAFIDDDAIPEPAWLDDLVGPYTDPSVGGVGGFVYDHTGIEFQSKYVTTDRLARPDGSWDRPTPEFNFPLSYSYPHLLGTNASFRRSMLLELGGFDEEYEYFLDETDMCCRVVDAGYKIIQLPNAFVHHRPAPSPLRDDRGVVRWWYPLLKNRVYFAFKNGLRHHSFQECVQAGAEDAVDWGENIAEHVSRGVYSSDNLERFNAEAARALEDGIRRGAFGERSLLTADTLQRFSSDFRPFKAILANSKRHTICFISQDYPPDQNGGIARYINHLATALAALGHNVHVITKSREVESVAMEVGVWVHRIAPRSYPLPAAPPVAGIQIPHHIWDWSRTAQEVVRGIQSKQGVSAVYAPLWDCEGIAFALDKTLPLITSLQTTMRFWLDNRPDKLADEPWMSAFGKPILAYEKFLFQNSTHIHSISNAIYQDIERFYGTHFERDRLSVIPLGLEDWAGADRAVPQTSGSGVRILFVGRLEARKGIAELLDALPGVLARYPEASVDIVGDDTIINADGNTYRAQFEARSIPDKIRERIAFHGRQSEEALRGYYAACDVFVAPSHYESFGLVFVEAMMFGKPVIGCRAGGMQEIIVEGETGLLAEAADRDSLTACLSRLISDASLRERLGKAGRERYERLFAVDAMAARFEELLHGLA